MTQSAYFVSRNRAIRVANDNGPIPLNVHHLPPMMQAGIRRNGLSEMVLFVEEGIVEFMIGGAAGIVSQGGFVRIPAETAYSFRNAGDETARLVTRVDPQSADTAA
jgi:mannose-6-phosphate isomerase-like protein (cupin superfamily)